MLYKRFYKRYLQNISCKNNISRIKKRYGNVAANRAYKQKDTQQTNDKSKDDNWHPLTFQSPLSYQIPLTISVSVQWRVSSACLSVATPAPRDAVRDAGSCVGGFASSWRFLHDAGRRDAVCSPRSRRSSVARLEWLTFLQILFLTPQTPRFFCFCEGQLR